MEEIKERDQSIERTTLNSKRTDKAKCGFAWRIEETIENQRRGITLCKRKKQGIRRKLV